MERIGKNQITDRQIYLVSLSQMIVSQSLKVPSQYFGVFLVCNARLVSDESVLEFARALLKEGFAYIYTWGEDSDRVNDLFDAVIVENDPNETEQSVRMTTCLPDITFEDALWHFLNVSFPADDYWEKCQAELLMVIGSSELAATLPNHPIVIAQI